MSWLVRLAARLVLAETPTVPSADIFKKENGE